MQQKDISANVTNLWQHDPFKAKWTILAKAYSVIRDASGKENAPIDKFVAINGPYIGILASVDYLTTLGWKLSAVDNQLQLTRDLDVEIALPDEGLLTTTLSVDNIIAYSVDMGYVSAERSGLSLHPKEASMVMVSSSIQRVATKASMDTQRGGSTSATVSNTNTGASNIGLGNATTATTNVDNDDWLEAALQELVDEDEANNKDAVTPADNDDISLMMLSSEFYALETEYPFNEEFDPDQPSFEFNPYIGDAFNAYHIGDFTEGNAFASQY